LKLATRRSRAANILLEAAQDLRKRDPFYGDPDKAAQAYTYLDIAGNWLNQKKLPDAYKVEVAMAALLKRDADLPRAIDSVKELLPQVKGIGPTERKFFGVVTASS